MSAFDESAILDIDRRQRSFVTRQSFTDGVINALVAAGITWATTRPGDVLPLTRPWNDTQPSLFGALLVMSLLMPAIVTLVSYRAARTMAAARRALLPDAQRIPRLRRLILVNVSCIAAPLLAISIVARIGAPGASVSRTTAIVAMVVVAGLVACWVSRRTASSIVYGRSHFQRAGWM